MLVLSRKLGQSIVFTGSIEVTVVDIHGDQVRLGVTAPRTIAVFRKELAQRNNLALGAGGDEQSEEDPKQEA